MKEERVMMVFWFIHDDHNDKIKDQCYEAEWECKVLMVRK